MCVLSSDVLVKLLELGGEWSWGGAEGAVVRDVESEKKRTERSRKREREIPKARRAGTEASRLGGRGGGSRKRFRTEGRRHGRV